jgi:hypothetical protein
MTAPDEEELTPAERRLRKRTVARPATRSGMIWVVSIALVLLGALGALISGTLLEDLTSHGDEGLAVGAAWLALLLSTVQAASGIGVFVGASWSRDGARSVCVINLVVGLFLLLNEGGPATLLGLCVNFVLLVALSGEKVRAWCR